MNQSKSLSQSSASQLADLPAYRPLIVAVALALLSGCSSLKGPERFEIPGNTSDFRSRLYAGAAVGSSRLSPDTGGTVFNVDSNSDAGTQLRLGYDVHNLLAVEVDTSVLGAADLREANTDVQYSSAVVSALIYGLSGVQMRSRREGLSAYGRIGYGALQKSSAVIDLEESGGVPVIGLGAEYGFSNGLGVRAEITRFDSDASFVGFGAIYRFGISPAGIGTMIAEAAEPALGAAHTTVARDGRVLTGAANSRLNPAGNRDDKPVSRGGNTDQQYYNADPRQGGVSRTVADRWRPAMRDGDRDADGVLDIADSCPSTADHVTVDRHGCGLFDAVLEDVTFKSGSRWLSPRARGQLDTVAETLLAFPESRVQVRAHTDTEGPADMNLSLSSRRAEVVVQYLQSRGVSELQLQAAGIGEAQPRDTNGSADGRRRNRRIDLVTLPDLDAGQLLVANKVGSERVISVSDAGQIQPQRDSYQEVMKISSQSWNSRNAKADAKNSKPSPLSTDAEPGLQAAIPSSKKDLLPVKTSAKLAARNKVQRPSIRPLPVPGVVPGFGVAGVVKGVSFDQGSSALSAQGRNALEPILTALSKNDSVSIAVMAHTDDSGDAETNLVLSKSRANAVVQHLTQSGIDASRLKSEGYGELLPLVQNVTEEDRSRNRRIEIRVLSQSE